METSEAEQLLKRLKDEYDRDVKAFSSARERIDIDLALAIGSAKDHWTEKDRNNRGAQRAELAIPVLNKYVDKVVGGYAVAPYGILLSSKSNDPQKAEIAKIKTAVIQGIEEESQAITVYMGALKHASACGYGYFYSTTKDIEGEVKPFLEWIDDPRLVVFDRNCRKPDGSDAERAYYSSSMSIYEAKRMYGEDVMQAHGNAWMPTAQYMKDSEDCQYVQIWEREYKDGKFVGVSYYRIVGNKLVDNGIISCKRLPIHRVAGRLAMIGKRPEFISITHNANGAQKLLDYAASMLVERLALSPIPAWVAPFEAVQHDMANWQNSNKNNASIRTYKQYTPDGKGLNAPVRDNDAVQIADVMGVLTGFTDFIDKIVGVQQTERVPNETAEAALLRKREMEQGEAEIYQHLADAIVSCGKTLNEILTEIIVNNTMMTVKDSGVSKRVEVSPEIFAIADESVSVEAGPMAQSQKKEKLAQAMASRSILGEARADLVLGQIADNMDNLDQEVVEAMKTASKQAVMALTGSNEDPQMMAQQMQATQDQVMQLQEQYNQANLYIQQQDAKIFALEQNADATIVKAQMDNETKLMIERIKQAGADERLQKELMAEYDAKQAEYIVKIAEAQAKQPKFELIENARPDYNAIGGMRNNFIQ